jgi:hypothetical protein
VRARPRSALHNAAEAGDTELLVKLLAAASGGGDDDFDPVRAACGKAALACARYFQMFCAAAVTP